MERRPGPVIGGGAIFRAGGGGRRFRRKRYPCRALYPGVRGGSVDVLVAASERYGHIRLRDRIRARLRHSVADGAGRRGSSENQSFRLYRRRRVVLKRHNLAGRLTL